LSSRARLLSARRALFARLTAKMERFLIRKKRKLSEDLGPQAEPRRICSWNADSLRLRAEGERIKQFVELVEGSDESGPVDLILVQECRMKGQLDRSQVESKLRRLGFKEFKFYWNLNPHKRYAGVLAMARKGHLPEKVETGFGKHLPECKYPGGDRNPEEEGRSQILKFKSFSLVHTYVPLSGWGEAVSGEVQANALKIAVRGMWDQRIGELIEALRKTSPVMWVGDLNVSRTELDVSHPMFFRNASTRTKDSKTLKGQPGFTKVEQDGFNKILDANGLVDTFRHFHPDERKSTWSGSPNNSRYCNKGMRLDYFLVSKEMLPRVSASVILERGFDSDHKAIMLDLKPGNPDPEGSAAKKAKTET